MKQENEIIPNWLLIVSGCFSLLEFIVTISLCFYAQSTLPLVDLNAKGVSFLIYMWATRQFALGFIFGFGVLKKSLVMLKTAYIFFLVMNIGDFMIGVSQKDNSLIIGTIIICLISSIILHRINKSIISK